MPLFFFHTGRGSRVLVLGASLGLLAACSSPPGQITRSPEGTVDAFYNALRDQNAALALSLLARDVMIFELGSIDRSRKDYGGVHLRTDMEAAGSLQRELLSRRRGGEGDERWVISTYRETGTFQGGEVDTRGTETVLLRLTGDSWKIVHLHFSNDLYVPKTDPSKQEQ